MNRRIERFLSCITWIGAVAGAASAQYQIDWFTVDGGGVMHSTGGTFDLSATIGQPDAAPPPTMFSGTHELMSGVWQVTQVCYCPGDVNGDGKRNGDDVAKFIGCLISGGSCPCADVDGTNGVALGDVTAFVADLLSTTPCL